MRKFDQKIVNIIVFIVIILCAAFGNILLKDGSDSIKFSLNPLTFLSENFKIVSGYVLYIIPTFLTIYLYKFYKLGFVQAVLSSIYVITPIAAYLLNIEKLNSFKILGIILIFFSVNFKKTKKCI